MRDKLREQLLARIQPALEQLAEQMIDMLLARIELHVNQLELAFDAATSAFASDLSVTDGAARRYDVQRTPNTDERRQDRNPPRLDPPGLETGERIASVPSSAGRTTARANQGTPLRALQQGQDLPPSTSSSTSEASAVEDSPRPTDTQQGAATPGQSASAAAGSVAEPHRVPTGHRDSDAAAVDASPRRICGCGSRGPHRKGCSLPNTSTSPASDPDPALTPPSSPATSPISRPSTRVTEGSERTRATPVLSSVPAASPIARPARADRFAEIEASAARREAAKRDRAERARSFIRRDGVRPTSSPSAADKAADEMGSLEPIASFEF